MLKAKIREYPKHLTGFFSSRKCILLHRRIDSLRPTCSKPKKMPAVKRFFTSNQIRIKKFGFFEIFKGNFNAALASNGR